MNTAVDGAALRDAAEGAAMLDRIRSLETLLCANVTKARSEHRVPTENIEALQQAGFFLALQPARWGGYELDPQDFADLGEKYGFAMGFGPGGGNLDENARATRSGDG